MSSSPSSVLLLGMGPQSSGLLITLGFGSGTRAPVVIDTHDGADELKRQFRKEIADRQQRRAQLEALFGPHPIESLPAPVAKAVKPYVPRKRREEPVVEAVRWGPMMSDEKAMRALMDEYAIYQEAELDDDFIITMFLH